MLLTKNIMKIGCCCLATLEDTMHDIALLKKLNKKQLTFVIKNDPCILNGSSLDVREMVNQLTNLKVKAETIVELIHSMGIQLAERNLGKLAFDYLQYADGVFGTKTAYKYAMQVLRLHLLEEIENANWYDFLHLGNDATKAEEFDTAFKAYSMALKLARKTPPKKVKTVDGQLTRPKPYEGFVWKALKRLRIASLKHLDLDVYLVCAELLEAKGMKIRSEHLQNLIAQAFCNHVDQIIVPADLSPLLKTIEKPFLRDKCMETAAREGEYELLQSLSHLWKLTISDRCLRLVLGAVWPKKTDDDLEEYDSSEKADIRLQVLRELAGRSKANAEKYENLLKRELLNATKCALKYGIIQKAHELATETDDPLTLEELTTLVRNFAGRVPYDEKHVPFAINLMVELVAKEKNK